MFPLILLGLTVAVLASDRFQRSLEISTPSVPSPSSPNLREASLALKSITSNQNKWQREFRNHSSRYYTEYLHSTPSQRSSATNLQDSLRIYNDLCVPHAEYSIDCNPIIQELFPLPFVSASPLLVRPIPKAESIQIQSNLLGGIEFPLDGFFPYQWNSLAMNTRFNDSNETVWDFLRQNVRSVIFRPDINLINESREITGTINPLTRTCIIKTPDNDLESEIQTFFTLVHEAFHLYSYTHAHTQNAEYHENRLLEERNAWLFTAKTRLAYIEQHHDELFPHILQMHVELYLRTLYTALSSNHALGLMDEDDEIHFDLDHPVTSEMRDSYPTDHLEGYVRMHDYDNVDDFIQARTERMMTEYSARPLP